MNVLSLFDGISCGQRALGELGIKVDNYFSSEINSNTIKITQNNYPNTIQLGDIKDWQNWKLPKIDLIMGGSPCQGFSFAGNRLNFEDPRSSLFFKYVDVLKYYNPQMFLLENVRMKKEWQNMITDLIGIDPYCINSNLFVPQNRVRLYWTNIKFKGLPTEVTTKTILDILQPKVSDHYYLSDRQLGVLDLNELKWTNNYIKKHFGGKHQQNSIYRYDGIMACLSAATHGAARHLTKTYLPDGKIRRLTEIECERLQGLPDNYTEGHYTDKVASSIRYEALGNGWTVSVIKHIFSGLRVC